MNEKKVTGIIKICIDLTDEEYEQIKQKVKGSRTTIFGFVWYAIQRALEKED